MCTATCTDSQSVLFLQNSSKAILHLLPPDQNFSQVCPRKYSNEIMAASSLDTFNVLPITMDETTKALSANSNDPILIRELEEVNNLHRALKSIPEVTDGVPPAPSQVGPKRSALIERMRQTGNNAFRKQNYAEAIDLYSHAISMALTRPGWEPSPLLRGELQQLYANRAQAHIGIANWPEALADANASIDFKRVGNAKAHWRKGKCLKEMGRLEEARDALEYGLEFGSDPELSNMLRDVNEMLSKRQ
jgi:translocation protein SEC72